MKEDDKLSYYMFQKFDPYNPTVLKEILSIRQKQLLDPSRKLGIEDLIYYRGIISGINLNALFRKEQNIPERYYNMFFGKDTENMHLFVSREQLKENNWENFSDFNSEKAPNIAKESKIIHALAHALQYAIDDHDGKTRNQTAVYPRTGEKCWQEFFSLFEVFNINNNVSGLNTEDIINYNIDSIVEDICKTKPAFRSEIYRCYFGIPLSRPTFKEGYLEVNETGENLLVSDDGGIISKIDNNAVQIVIQSGMVIDHVSGFSIYLKSKAKSFSSNDTYISTTPVPVIIRSTLSTQVSCSNPTGQSPTITTDQSIAQQPTTIKKKKKRKKKNKFAVGPIIIINSTESEGYNYFKSKEAAGIELEQKTHFSDRTIRQKISDYFNPKNKNNNKDLEEILQKIGTSCSNVYILPTPSASNENLVDPKKVLSRDVLKDNKIDIDKFKETVKQTTTSKAFCKTYYNAVKDW